MTLENLLNAHGFKILGNKSIFKKEVSSETVKEYSQMLEKLKIKIPLNSSSSNNSVNR